MCHRLIVLILLAVATGVAQMDSPGFDVASVKLLPPHEPPFFGGAPPPPPPPPGLRVFPQGVSILSANLKYALTWAYDLRAWQISGPDWIESEQYDIVAKSSVHRTTDELRRMMQALLAERFRLTLRRDRKEAPVMALVVAKGGHKLKVADPAEKPDTQFSFGPDGIRNAMRNRRVAELEGLISSHEWDPVVDRTALPGGFTFTYVLPRRDPEGNFLGQVQSSLESQLGLKLERRREPVDFLVVTAGDRKPIEN